MDLAIMDLYVAVMVCGRHRRSPLPLLGRLSTVPNFTSSLLMLFLVQPVLCPEIVL